MTDKYAQTRCSLWELSREIYDYAYERYSLPNDWEGDEIVITPNKATNRENADSGIEQITIVTPATREVAWLFARLRDAFGSLINGASKAEFYARLARAISIHEMKVDREHRVNSMLRAVMDKAFALLEEMEKRTFETLSDNENKCLADVKTIAAHRFANRAMVRVYSSGAVN